MKGLRRAVLPTVVGAIAVAALHALGVQSPFAWAWGILAAGVALLLGIRMPEDPRLDAPGRPADQRYVGSEVSRLAWAIDARNDTVNEAVTRRVRATLRRRLSRLGIDVDDVSQAADVDRLLGAGLWRRLTGRRTTIRDIRDGLDAAERLEGITSSTASPGGSDASVRPTGPSQKERTA
ncbi:hypothetical protein FVO59_15485 [Microbacterium esteraromaticum]|uniref:Uncharacterized protein n=2 Tax=Microbacterium esteraromaticum TaxID=57043 RepID=A0A7D8AKZ3_9MICO|nr:hypothetical protein FVO59_15485 [Microbacterium esteraromaticum]